MDTPFRDEDNRNVWADQHRRNSGHTVRLVTDRRWRDPNLPVAQGTEHPPPKRTVAGSNPARETFLTAWMVELLALTPHIDAAKVGTDHEGHPGWNLTHKGTFCSCGTDLMLILRRNDPSPPAGGAPSHDMTR